MCQVALLNYANYLNENPDALPQPLFWTGAGCTGTQWPPSQKSLAHDAVNIFVNDTTGVFELRLPASHWNAQSWYLPANLYAVELDVILNGTERVTKHMVTPMTVPQANTLEVGRNIIDAALSTKPPARVEAVNTLRFKRVSTDVWHREYMCMLQRPFTIDVHPVFQWSTRSPFCDQLVETYCKADPVHMASQLCTCFREQAGLETTAATRGTTLGVYCFGRDCARGVGYASNAMLQVSCNVRYCQQVIADSGAAALTDVSLNNVIYCGGVPYDADTALTLPIVPRAALDGSDGGHRTHATPAHTKQSTAPQDLVRSLEHQPLYVWLILAVTVLVAAGAWTLMYFSLRRARTKSNVRGNREPVL